MQGGFDVPFSHDDLSKPSEEGDAIGFETLFAVDYLDPHPLPWIEGCDAAPAERGDVNEHILAAAIGRNESIALLRLEPFRRAFHRLGRHKAAAIDTAACALRRHRGAVV